MSLNVCEIPLGPPPPPPAWPSPRTLPALGPATGVERWTPEEPERTSPEKTEGVRDGTIPSPRIPPPGNGRGACYV